MIYTNEVQQTQKMIFIIDDYVLHCIGSVQVYEEHLVQIVFMLGKALIALIVSVKVRTVVVVFIMNGDTRDTSHRSQSPSHQIAFSVHCSPDRRRHF